MNFDFKDAPLTLDKDEAAAFELVFLLNTDLGEFINSLEKNSVRTLQFVLDMLGGPTSSADQADLHQSGAGFVRMELVRKAPYHNQTSVWDFLDED